jgi:hypothetical protein
MRREILRAIAFHSCPEVYHVQFDTLAFVLYILDEIQEWGRPTLDELQTREQKRVTSTVVEFKPKHISVALKYKRRWTRKDLPDLENKLNQLHKRVRLGADTYVSEDQHLEFRMEDSAGKKAYFLLNKQRISRHVPPKKSLPSNA